MSKTPIKYFLVNLDLETGGFDGPTNAKSGKPVLGAAYHPILEVCASVLNSDLEEINRVHEFILDGDRIDNMNQDTLEFHKKKHDDGDGLTADSFHDLWMRSSKISLYGAEEELIRQLKEAWPDLKEYHPKNQVHFILTGRSCHFDRAFINNQMPRLAKYLSHQHIDVSAFRTVHRLWHDNVTYVIPGFPIHNASDDVDYIHSELEVISRWISATTSDTKYLADEAVSEVTWCNIFGIVKDKLLSYFIR